VCKLHPLWVKLLSSGVLSSHVHNFTFVIQSLREERDQWKKAYKDLLEHGPKNLPLARSRVSWLYIEFGDL